MGLDPSAVWDFAAELVGSVRGGSRRTTATVTRIDADGTTWVSTGDGGEAPATSVGAGVSVGDTVTLEWDGSAMGIRSNVSNPAPAGSVVRRAIERTQGVASAAQRVADAVNQHFFADGNGIHVTEATQEDWDENHSGANVLINSIGQLFRDGLNNLLTLTTENGARALTVWDGLGNTASHIRAIIGEVITLGPIGSVQMILSSGGLEIDNESGATIFEVDTTGGEARTRAKELHTWDTTASVTMKAYVAGDDEIADGDTTVTATVNGTEYTLDSSYANVAITAGVSVSVNLTQSGVPYVRELMVELDDDGNVTATYPCTLSIEYTLATTVRANLSFVGDQLVDGVGGAIVAENTVWSADNKTDVFLVARNAETGAEIRFGVGAGGYNRGVYDPVKKDWLLYRNADGKTVINGPNFSVAASGATKCGLAGNFTRTSVTVVSSQSLAVEGYLSGTASLTKAGWKPIGIAGWHSTSRFAVTVRAYVSGASNGSGTLNWEVYNARASSITASVTIYVLWARV